jgi:hypothetical protein
MQFEPNTLWRPGEALEDAPAPEVGDIRLLAPELTDHVSIPVYVTVLAEWEDGLVLACPFSPFMSPATSGEFLTGSSAHSLRVLSPWATVSLLRGLVARSWRVERMNKREMHAAWQVFRHAATGSALTTALKARTGPPIVHPLDPRIQYQTRLASVLAPLVEITAAAVQEEEDVAGLRLVLSSFPGERRLAADTSEEVSCRLVVKRRQAKRRREDFEPAGHATARLDTGRFILEPEATLSDALRPTPGDVARLVSANNGRLLGHGIIRCSPDSGRLLVDLAGEWRKAARARVIKDAVLVILKTGSV